MNLKKLAISCALLSTASLSAQIDNLTKSESEFAFSLYDALDTQNLIISPYSIYTCLLMTYLGAREETSKQMQEVLFLNLPAKELPKYNEVLSEQLQGSGLHMANALWVSPKTFVLTDYRHMLEKQFQAHVESVNFEDSASSTNTINAWIAKHTDDKIPALLQKDDLDKNTRLVLTNAVYFQGNFLKPFDPKDTVKAPFFISSEKQEEVEMMSQTMQFFYSDTEDFQAISLPFKDTTFACVLLLSKHEISDMHTALSAALEKQQRTQVHLKVPKFTLTQRFTLNELLKTLGMVIPFTTQANFSGIDGLRNLYITQAIHEASFALDEYGVLATASTSAALGLTGVLDKTPPVELTFDRPFLFFLVDINTKTILFMGRYSCNSCH